MKKTKYRERVLELTRKYISEDDAEFIPGTTYVRTSGASWNADDVCSVVDVALERWYTDAGNAHEFERLLSTTVKQRYSVLCNSGSSANLLAISSLMSKRLGKKALRRGDEVITVAAGFPTTVNPIIQNGLVPVFVDINIPTYNALPHAIEEAVSSKTRAIMIAHTLGNPYNAEEVRQIADRNELWVVADCCFVAGTKIKTVNGDTPIEKVKVGDLVLTRNGYRKVIANKKTGTKRVITNMGLTGTPDHPVITKNGIKRLDALSASDIIYTWNQNTSSITEQSIQESQTLLGVTCGSITGEDCLEKEHLSIDKNTLTLMGRYQMDLTSTTLTETHLTTTFPILRLSRAKNTQEVISTGTAKWWQEETLSSREKKQESGTKTQTTDSFMLKLEKNPGKIKKLTQKFVKLAKENIKRIFLQDQCIALENVRIEAEVYNLCVEGEHEYFANNILVHNCDALGSEFMEKPLPFYADVATYSFYPAHHISMGEGGAVVTNSPMLDKIIRSFRDWGRDCWCPTGKDNTCGKRYGWQLGTLPHGFDHKYTYSEIGYNLKVTDLQAALGLSQIKRLPEFTEARRENWNFYKEKLSDLEEFFILPEPTRNSNPSWFGFMISVKDTAPFSRNDIVEFLEKNKIGTRMLFAGNLTRHPAYDDVKSRVSNTLHKSDFVMNNGFWIGVAPIITPPMREYVVEKFHEFIKGIK